MECIRPFTNGTDLSLPNKSREGSRDLSSLDKLSSVICLSVIVGGFNKLECPTHNITTKLQLMAVVTIVTLGTLSGYRTLHVGASRVNGCRLVIRRRQLPEQQTIHVSLHVLKTVNI